MLLIVGAGILTWSLLSSSSDPAAPPPVAAGVVESPSAAVPGTADPSAVEPDPVGNFSPGTLTMDRISITAPIVEATVPDGVLTPPEDVSKVGIWMGGAPLDSKTGTTLLAGHVNMAGQGNGALFDLSLMKPGDLLKTTDSGGVVTQWRVTRVVDRPKADGVEESVLDGPAGPRKLAVVTCGGELDYANGVGNYEDNVYVYADAVA